MKKTAFLFRFSAAGFCFAFWILFAPACGSPNAPLDADTRHYIDSTVTKTNRAIQTEIDSQCNLAMTRDLPRLVDSIKKVRQREIEEQLKRIPR